MPKEWNDLRYRLLLFILLVLFTGTSSVSSFHSRSAGAPLHFIRQSRSNFPFKQVRSLAYPFFIRVRKVYTSTVRHTHRYAPNFYAIFIQVGDEKKKERAILLTHSPRLQKPTCMIILLPRDHTRPPNLVQVFLHSLRLGPILLSL